MELQTAIEILEYHQKWRLGKREDMIHEPKKLTEALNIVLSEVKKMETLNKNKMSNHVLNINTILHTKDGRKIGNAIVTGRDGYYWEITTDYGNKARFTSEEIDEQFNIAWLNFSKENEGSDCREMQEMMSANHKHRVF